jgi:pSer/pThr/pTyr-binding forkhead associated (FHA) protein
MFGRKIVKRCPKGHEMDLAWRRCPRCSGGAGGTTVGRDITDQTVIVGAGAEPADATRIVSPSLSRAPAVAAEPAEAASPPPPPIRIEVTTGPRGGETIRLPFGIYRLGKAPKELPDTTPLAFPGDRFMSKDHVVLTVGAAHTVLTDPGSTNGTLVNEQKVTRTILADGDVVQAGETTFRFRSGA